MAKPPIQWSINMLSAETGIDRRTVTKRLRRLKPTGTTGNGPTYSGPDVFSYLFSGGFSEEQEAENCKRWAEAEMGELELLAKMRKVIPKAYISEALAIVHLLLQNELMDGPERDRIMEMLTDKMLPPLSEEANEA